MKVTILNSKASSILFDGKFIDTGKPLDLPFSDAMRLSRIAEVDMVHTSVAYDPTLWSNDRFINLFGDIDGVSGFGGVSQALIRYANVRTAHMGRVNNVRENAIFTAQNRDLNQAGAMVWHDQPRDQWLHSPFQKNIAILPFETTRIPRSWVGKLAHFDAIFTPCQQNIQMFRDSGITIPIHLLKWGYDATKFRPILRPERPMFTFGHMGALSIRKGTDLLVQAFTEAFPRETDVQLICKSSFPNYPFSTKDKRIKIHLTPWDHEDLMKNFYGAIDCFVFPTRGEGWGLTPMEAMATGVPAIVTGWSGPMEYMSEEDGWLIDYKMVHADNFSNDIYKEDCGDWAEPDIEHLKFLMRYAYENRDETKEKGKKAEERMARDFTWEESIKTYEDALGKTL
jgi:glycosyltransferase involved in cell wall biosynthesis